MENNYRPIDIANCEDSINRLKLALKLGKHADLNTLLKTAEANVARLSEPHLHLRDGYLATIAAARELQADHGK